MQYTLKYEVTKAEIDRVEKEISDLRAALSLSNSKLADREAKIVALEAEVLALKAQLAAQPPPPVNPPPPPPMGSHPRLYTAGGKLYTRNGEEVQLRGIELMILTDVLNVGPVEIAKRCKALGANTISPLFRASSSSAAAVQAWCDAAKAEGLIIGVNADHISGGRAWLCKPEIVAVCNACPHVFLECEVETDEVQDGDDARWIAGVKSLIDDLRAAGHKSIIKVGAPQGGRRVEFPLKSGAQVVNLDPLKQVVFTFQAYWKESTAGSQWYQNCAGVAAGLAGTKQALTKCAQSGLCFIPGFDWEDDIGTTGELALMDHAHSLGLSYQHWALTGDGGLPGNNLIDRFDWTVSLASTTPNGQAIKAKMTANRQFKAL